MEKQILCVKMMVSPVHYSSPCKDVFLIQVKEYVVQVVTEALGWSSEPGSRFIVTVQPLFPGPPPGSLPSPHREDICASMTSCITEEEVSQEGSISERTNFTEARALFLERGDCTFQTLLNRVLTFLLAASSALRWRRVAKRLFTHRRL